MAQDLCARLREKKLISIVRGAPTEKITKIADAIYRGGFRFMEITFDQSGKTPHAVTAEQIRIVREAFDGRLHVGAGTVMTEAQLKLAAEAGAEYIISPNVDTAIIRATKAVGLISIPGAFTPSEISGRSGLRQALPGGLRRPEVYQGRPCPHQPHPASGGQRCYAGEPRRLPERRNGRRRHRQHPGHQSGCRQRGLRRDRAARGALCGRGGKRLIPSEDRKNPAGVCNTSRGILCPRGSE